MAKEATVAVQVNLAYLGSGPLREFAESGIYPAPKPENIQPASIDLHLSSNFYDFAFHEGGHWPNRTLDPREDNTALGWHTQTSEFIVPPRGFVLASTAESVNMPVGFLGRVEGKSSLGRLGLQVHVTAGFIDPGFSGKITLEIHNLLPMQWMLMAGMPICQLSVATVEGAEAYAGKYGGAQAPQPSRFHKNYDAATGRWK